MPRSDVVVVGAGLAGLSAAEGMARRGLLVVLVDRRVRVDARVRTTGIFVRRTLEDFDLPASCLGPPVRRVLLYSPSGRALTLESLKDEFRVGRMGALYSRKLEECLRAGVRWLPGTSYLGAEPHRGGSRVYLERAGLREAWGARLVVGADGARSRVARDLGLAENRQWLLGLEEVPTAPATSRPPAFHCFLDPACAPGYIGWVVEDGESVHIGVAGHARGYEPAAALASFRARAPGLGALAPGRPLERRGGLIPVGGVLDRIGCARGLLVGDAAGAVSPLTAGGLDACLRLSRYAADVAQAHLSGHPNALEAYAGERFRSRLVSRLALRRALDWGGRSALLLEAACAVLRTPPLALVARHVFFGRGSFPLPAPPAPAEGALRLWG